MVKPWLFIDRWHSCKNREKRGLYYQWTRNQEIDRTCTHAVLPATEWITPIMPRKTTGNLVISAILAVSRIALRSVIDAKG